MKNIKRITALIIVLAIVCGAFSGVSAIKLDKWYSEAVEYLEAAKIAEIGSKAESKLTKAAFSLWIAKIESGAFFVESQMWKNDGLADIIVFNDVDATLDGIYRSAINYCYQRGFVSSSGEKTFSPEGHVTLAQMCKAIVVLMGYQYKVADKDVDWEYNYFNVANNYCNVFDKVFMDHMSSVDATNELTYGEAAYLLAMMLNFGEVNEKLYELRCLTSNGENLGEKFPAYKFSYAKTAYAVVSGLQMTKGFVTNTPASTVYFSVLKDIGETSYVPDYFVVYGDEIEKDDAVEGFYSLVRGALGLESFRDVKAKEKFNLGDYVVNGSLVKIKIDASSNIVGLELFTVKDGTRLISDTFLVAATGSDTVYNDDGSVRFYGNYPYLANRPGSASADAVLKNSYFAEKAIEFDGSGDAVTLVLGSRGYSIVQSDKQSENEIVVYSTETPSLTPLTDAEAVDAIPTVSEGEHYVEFYDVDKDGYFDVALVGANASFTTSRPDIDLSRNTISAHLIPSDKYGIGINRYANQVLWNVSTGYVESVGKDTVMIEGTEHYVVTISDVLKNEKVKVYVPTEAPSESYENIYLKVAGEKATANVNTTGWLSFLGKESEYSTEGIGSVVNAQTGAWMISRVVKYATIGDNAKTNNAMKKDVLVYMQDTTSSSVADGFVIDVEKTGSGDNTYFVTLGVTSESTLDGGSTKIMDKVSAVDVFFTYLGGVYRLFRGDGQYAFLDGASKTGREAMTVMGWTDVDRWANYADANKGVDFAFCDAWEGARRIIIYGDYSAECFEQTLAGADSHSINMLSAAKGYILAVAKKIDPAANESWTVGKALDSIPGFDKSVLLENLKNNASGVYVQENHYYAYLRLIERIIMRGFLNTSPYIWSLSNSQASSANKAPDYGWFSGIYSAKGAESVRTYEIRANASSLWDYDNYTFYHEVIFNGKKLIETERSSGILTGYDLVYAEIINDGAEQYVLKRMKENGASVGTWQYVNAYSSGYTVNGDGTLTGDISDGSLYKGYFAYRSSSGGAQQLRASWTQYESPIALTDVSGDLSLITAEGSSNVVMKLASAPYYKKVYFGGEVVGFERHATVGTYNVAVSSSYIAKDPIKTYIPVVYLDGEPVRVTSSAEKQKWEKNITTDVNGVVSTYEVVDGLLYKVNTVKQGYLLDESGNKVLRHTIDFSSRTLIHGGYEEDVVIGDDEIFSMMEIRALSRGDSNYFSGGYEVKFNGKTFYCSGNVAVEIMQPNIKTGELDGISTTVKDICDSGAKVFVSHHQTAYSGTRLEFLSVIGEISNSNGTDDETKTKIVYLSCGGVTVEADETGKYFIVRSYNSAVELPSCNDAGSIYRKYSTYEDAKQAAEVDVAISAGYYVIKEDGEIVSNADIVKHGKITSVDSAGNVKATMNGVNVDAKGYDWAFIYEDFDGNVFAAGDSTAVTISSFSDAEKTLKPALDAVIEAEKDYANAVEYGMSDSILASLKAEVEAKRASYADAKKNAVKKYFDGRFWGVEDSPAYKYINSYKYTYQKDPDPISFDYISIDGKYVVFVGSFFK